MRGSDLSPEQCDKIHGEILPTLGYLHRLEARMNQRGFPEDDELRQLVKLSIGAMKHLARHVHYLACRQSMAVGEPGAAVKFSSGPQLS